MSRIRMLTLLGTSALLLAASGAATAQEETPSDAMDGPSVEVVGVEYAFEGLPTSVPAGTTFTFSNAGVEIHQMLFNRIADGVTESAEELLVLNARGVDLVGEGYVDTEFDDPVLEAFPGATADGSVTLDQEGRYVILCFVPTGLEPRVLESFGVDVSTLGPETDLSTLPQEAQAFIEQVSANPPHITQGMLAEFVVTAAGTEMGPLPSPATDEVTPSG